jgi:hypothetical protein
MRKTRSLSMVVLSIVVGGPLAAEEPTTAGKKAPAPAAAPAADGARATAREKAATTRNVTPGAATNTARTGSVAKGDSTPVADPRATSLFKSAQNLEQAGKAAAAIGLFRDVLIKYPRSPEASMATARLTALGGKIPTPAEIKPAPPPEKASFTRAPKPKYASQAAARAAMNQAIGGMINQPSPAPSGGGYGAAPGRAPY